MRAVVQRVLRAVVKIENNATARIGRGLLVYLSIAKTDMQADAEFIADKLVNLRIFADNAGKMNRSVRDVQGGILIVSNFTLHGDCRKGRRPSFDNAAEPELARRLYEKLIELISKQAIPLQQGSFGGYMQVSSINDGPVTLLLDSSRLF